MSTGDLGVARAIDLRAKETIGRTKYFSVFGGRKDVRTPPALLSPNERPRQQYPACVETATRVQRPYTIKRVGPGNNRVY